MAETTQSQQFEYKAEMQQLLHLIVNSLYTNQEIFLRELISNASDALNKARIRQLTDHSEGDKKDLQITITVDEEANTLSIEDTGIGMTRDDLINRLGTVASSGTLAFIEEQKAAGKKVDVDMIGKFGVGFYSAFMVADQIEIETLHAGEEAESLNWSSDGAGTYTISPGTRSEHGTNVKLHLKEDAKDFATELRVRSVIRKYSNFVDFPIILGSEQANTIKALWRKRKDDITDEERNEFYKFLTGDYSEHLGHLHLQIEGLISFGALFFIPSQPSAPFFQEENQRGLHLYCSGVFVRDDAQELLPDYLQFVKGVVDTDDLPLNVSREVTQNSPAAQRIRSTLTNKILGLLKDWTSDNEELYNKFFGNFGGILKAGFWSDYDRRDELLELMRYYSTHSDGRSLTALKDYVERMPEDQENIYYLLSDSLESARTSPHLEVFARKGIEVLLLPDPVDTLTLPNMADFEGKSFKSITGTDLDLSDDSEEVSLPDDDTDTLLKLFRVQLGDRIQDVAASKRLVDSAATLVTAKDGMDPQMERMMKSMNPDYEGTKKVLEVNVEHPLMQNILALNSEKKQTNLVGDAIEQVYEGALLIDGNLSEPSAYVARMTRILVDATNSN